MLAALRQGWPQALVAASRAEREADIATPARADHRCLRVRRPARAAAPVQPPELAAGPGAGSPRSRRFRLARGLRAPARPQRRDPGRHRRAAAGLPVHSGPPDEFAARAGFARNLFEAGGFAPVAGEPLPSLEELGHAFRASGARQAAICSSDANYAAMAEPAARALKHAHARQRLPDGPAGRGAARGLAGGRRRRVRPCGCATCWRRSSAPARVEAGERRMTKIPSFADMPLGPPRAGDPAPGPRLRRRDRPHAGAAGLDHARGHRRPAALHRRRHRRARLPAHLAGPAAVPARPLPHHVRDPALDDPAVCRLLHGRGQQRLLPAQPRRRAEGPVGRLRPRHPPRLRQRPPARGRRCRHGRRRHRFDPRHADPVLTASRSTR